MEKTRKTLIIFACLLAFSLLFSICISAVPAKMTVSGRFFGGEVIPNMEEADVAFFGVCHSAHGYDTGGLSDNYLTEAVSNGALNAIGYCEAYNPERVSEFYEIFCNQTGTVKMRFEKALGVFSGGVNIDERDIPVLLQPTKNRSGEVYITRWVFDGEVLVSQTTLVKLSFKTKENKRENREPIEVQITHAEFDGDVYVIKTETAIID